MKYKSSPNDFLILFRWPPEPLLLRALKRLPLPLLSWLRPLGWYFRWAYTLKLCAVTIQRCYEALVSQAEGGGDGEA